MKKAITIIYACLAVLFFSKEIIYSVCSLNDSYCYNIDDLNQKESKEESEKEKVEKEGFEEGRLNHFLGLTLQYSKIENHFSFYKEKSHFIPYFEVYSPPPELV